MLSFEPAARRAATASATAVVLTVAADPEAPAAARDAIGAGLAVRVSADVSGGILRVEVDDAGTAGTIAARPPTPEGGFGLHLVEALAQRWGVTREGFTRVWVELACRPSRD